MFSFILAALIMTCGPTPEPPVDCKKPEAFCFCSPSECHWVWMCEEVK
jgi:hypothetical protein